MHRLSYIKLLTIVLILPACKETTDPVLLPYELMEEGDLAFRCGYGVFSRAVTTYDNDCVYSHVGVLVREGEQWCVIHAVPRELDHNKDFARVKEESVELFYHPARAYRGCLVHTGSMSSATIARIREAALQYVRDSVRFDNTYDIYDSSKVYCTEFVWRLYLRIGVDLSEGKRRYINAFNIHNDCILPEHILNYHGNEQYYSF